jgi:tetratricopeptide (TPR) repeat protein
MSDALPRLGQIDFEALFRSGEMARVIALTDDAANISGVPPSVFFFRAKALFALSRFSEAYSAVEAGLALNPDSGWGQALRFESLLALERFDESFAGLFQFLQTTHADVESLKAAYVDRAVRLGRFDLAAPMNEMRKVIAEDRALPRYALAVQCFSKSDTLEKVFASLIECRGTKEYGLIILQDNADGSRKRDVYEQAAESVRLTLGKWLPKLMLAFDSVEIILNPNNKGTAPSCRRLLDRVCERFDGFLFIEDDCLLSPDALEWSSYHLGSSISPTNFWFGTCESIFFDASRTAPSPEQVELLSRYARSPEVRATYIGLDFVPSTCFLTTKQIWRMVSNTWPGEFECLDEENEATNSFSSDTESLRYWYAA